MTLAIGENGCLLAVALARRHIWKLMLGASGAALFARTANAQCNLQRDVGEVGWGVAYTALGIIIAENTVGAVGIGAAVLGVGTAVIILAGAALVAAGTVGLIRCGWNALK
jgi:hypothetical protein